MTQRRPVVVLVDAYTSAQYLAPQFRALGADVVHVQSTAEFMPSMPAPDLSGYRASITHDHLDSTVARLREFDPVCVIPGQEPGVELADALSERVGGVTNGTALSAARRDKHLMIETLRAAGLHCADQLKSGDIDEVVDWARHRMPVVVKPLKSAAGDHVYVCRTTEEVRDAAKTVLSSETIYGESNEDVLVQSYLDGVEYVVDMVSCRGERYLCGVWSYEKKLLPNGRNIYHHDRLVASDETPVPAIVSYVDRALTALGVDHGPTHAEVIVTAGGPALVEVGARIAGNMHPGFHDRCLGGNQATITAVAYLDPDRFLAEYAGRTYAKLLDAVCVTTSTTLSGVVDRIDTAVVAEIRNLETVYGLDLKLEPGQVITPTVDLYSSTMRIFQCSRDRAALERDQDRIEDLKDRVYRLRDENSGER